MTIEIKQINANIGGIATVTLIDAVDGYVPVKINYFK